MKIYNTPKGVVIEKDASFYAVNTAWDTLVSDDNALQTAESLLQGATAGDASLVNDLLPTMGKGQELWACGVTYLRSKVGRQEESKAAGGGDFYEKVYHADRPEVFFKATPNRVVGHGQPVRIRKDSTWDVPEPELTLVVTSSGKIIGYTIGNDMSSRSIEGENPLYLPQAKTYDKCAAVGPCVYLTDKPLDQSTIIHLTIKRNGDVAFDGTVDLGQLKRKPEELVSYVFREASFPNGCLVMTGTGIVPGNDFTLKSGDEISIAIDGIGTLVNTVE
jgi:2-dehydro-3-deoxy-D-arabinonate dehydratase